jgi:hypothetical protein
LVGKHGKHERKISLENPGIGRIILKRTLGKSDL